MSDADGDVLIDFTPIPAPPASTAQLTSIRNHLARAASGIVSIAIGLMLMTAYKAYLSSGGSYVETGRFAVTDRNDQVLLTGMMIPAMLLVVLSPFARRRKVWAIQLATWLLALVCFAAIALAVRVAGIAITGPVYNPWAMTQAGALFLLAITTTLVIRTCQLAIQQLHNEADIVSQIQTAAMQQQQCYAYQQQQQPPTT